MGGVLAKVCGRCAENLQDTDGTPVEVKSTAPDGLNSDRDWMNTWTIFYWGWWIAWAPFVGMFIAKISRGRTVRQIINGALTGPVIYSFFWFAIFGGTALRVERQAANLGIQCNVDDNDSIQYIRVTPSDTLGLPLDSPMVELEGRQFWRLSCRETTDMWFDVFANYPLHKCGLPLPPMCTMTRTQRCTFGSSICCMHATLVKFTCMHTVPPCTWSSWG